MIRLRTLGESVIEVGSVCVAPDADVLFAVLVFLTAERGRPHGRDTLTDLLWPRLPHDRARHCLRQTVYKLRQLGVRLRCTHGHVELPPDLVEPGFAAELTQRTLEEERSAGRLRLGAFLPGYAPTFSAPFAEWLERRRDHVHSHVRRALLAAMQDRKVRGEWGEVESLARECLALDALNEEATLALAETAALSGGKTEALAILDQYIQELGPLAADIRVPASVLRRRIAERFPVRRYVAPSERCFVGRETQMALVSTALQRARNGEGSALLLWGPPGIGKTRIATEVRRVAMLQGVRVVRAVCEETDAARPMGVWIDAVPQLLSLPGALGCAPETLAYLRRLTEHDRNATTPSPESRDAEFLAASVRRAIVDLMDAVSGEVPVLLVVEDVHWVDGASWTALRELMDWSTAKRVLLLLTARTPHATPRPPARVSPRLELVPVPPLDARAGEALLRAMVPPDRVSALTSDVIGWCLGVGEGNPLFLHELASHWGETGRTHEVPASLQNLIDARISALRPAALYVLQACAVLARNATVARLEALLELRVHELLGCLAELSDGRLIVEDEGRIAPLHDLVARCAMATISRPALRLLHYSAAAVLEREVRAGEGSHLLWDCARHWQEAGQAARAVELVLWSARQMLELGAPAGAVDVLSEAVEFCKSTTERILLTEELTLALRSSGRWLRVRDNIERTISYRSSLAGHRVELPADVLARIEADYYLQVHGEVLMEEARSCALNATWPPDARVRAATWALILADNFCNAEVAHEVYRQSRALAQIDRCGRADTLRHELIYHTIVGECNEAITCARELDSLAQRTSSLLDRARILRHTAQAYSRAGLFVDAERNLEESFTIGQSHGLHSAALVAADFMATLQFEIGNLDASQRWTSWCRVSLETIESPELELSVREMETRLALYAGEYAQAHSLLTHSLRDILELSALRTRAHLLTTFTQLQLCRSTEELPLAVIDALLSLHQRKHVFGGHDRYVSVLYQALRRNGHEAVANTCVRAYLQSGRRERTTLPWYFREAVSNQAAWCRSPSHRDGPLEADRS